MPSVPKLCPAGETPPPALWRHRFFRSPCLFVHQDGGSVGWAVSQRPSCSFTSCVALTRGIKSPEVSEPMTSHLQNGTEIWRPARCLAGEAAGQTWPPSGLAPHGLGQAWLQAVSTKAPRCSLSEGVTGGSECSRPGSHRLLGPLRRPWRHQILCRRTDWDHAGLCPQAGRAVPCPPLTSLGLGPPGWAFLGIDSGADRLAT